MPTIWNVNQNNITNNKLSSKLTFSVGEKFIGKIIGKSEGNLVQIKLPDGWQFTGELDTDIEINQQIMLRFQVVGYSDNKLMLKLVQGDSKQTETKTNLLMETILKEGLEDGDSSIIKSMINSNIPLTRDNISFIKGIIQFKEKINQNSDEIERFIDNFIQSKNIDSTSEQAKSIKSQLSDFFLEFKNLSQNDILFFVENNIEFTKENIDSYNKLFNSNSSIKEFFDGLKQPVKNFETQFSNSEIPNKEMSKNKLTSNQDINNKVENEEITVTNTEVKSSITNQAKSTNNIINNIAAKVYDSVETKTEKTKVLNLLKSMVNVQSNTLKEALNDILSNRMEKFNLNEYTNAIDKLDNVQTDELINVLSKNISTKEELSKVISNLYNKNIELTDVEFKKLTDLINLNLNNSTNSGMEQGETTLKKEMFENVLSKAVNNDVNLSDQDIKSLTESFKDIKSEFVKLSDKDIIKNEMLSKIDDIKEVVKDIIKLTENTKLDNHAIVDFIKSNISDFKMFNTINNQYYYLDVPVNRSGEEYPCKLIIKDNRKQGKQIDKNDVKMVVSIKTVNLGEVDGYLSIRNSSIDVNLKCNGEVIKLLDSGKQKLIDGLKAINLYANVTVTKRTESVSLSNCVDFFNEKVSSSIDTKV